MKPTLFLLAALSLAVPAAAQGVTVQQNLPMSAPSIIGTGTLSAGFEGDAYGFTLQSPGPNSSIDFEVDVCPLQVCQEADWRSYSSCSFHGDYEVVKFSDPPVYLLPLTPSTFGCSGSAGPDVAGNKVRINVTQITGTWIALTVSFGTTGG